MQTNDNTNRGAKRAYVSATDRERGISPVAGDATRGNNVKVGSDGSGYFVGDATDGIDNDALTNAVRNSGINDGAMDFKATSNGAPSPSPVFGNVSALNAANAGGTFGYSAAGTFAENGGLASAAGFPNLTSFVGPYGYADCGAVVAAQDMTNAVPTPVITESDARAFAALSGVPVAGVENAKGE